MTHTIRDKQKLINRVRRIRGQMEAVERMLEAEKECEEIMQVIAGVRGAVNGLMAEVIEGHVMMHLAEDGLTPRDRNEAATQLMDVIRAYLK